MKIQPNYFKFAVGLLWLSWVVTIIAEAERLITSLVRLNCLYWISGPNEHEGSIIGEINTEETGSKNNTVLTLLLVKM